MDQEYEREEELRDRQDGRTFRVGRVLRGTYDDEDEILEPAMTRLMLELTHLPYEEQAFARPVRSPPTEVREPPSLLRRLVHRLNLA